jgi:phosphinothricin acetyltransferase
VIRAALEADDAQVAAIWNVEAVGTFATTETEPRGPEAQRAWRLAHTEDHPVVVALAGDEVVAFGSLSPYRAKAAYRRTAEDSVYVKDGWRGKGLGGRVLEDLVRRARERGHHSLLARVTSENEASLRLHERHGFARVGCEREVAFKLGRWLDVVTLQRLL